MVNDELVEQLRAAYEEWIQGNPEPAVAMLSDDITWIVPGNSVERNLHNGIDGDGPLEGTGAALRGLELQQDCWGATTWPSSTWSRSTAGSAFQVDVWRFEGGKAISTGSRPTPPCSRAPTAAARAAAASGGAGGSALARPADADRVAGVVELRDLDQIGTRNAER